jgi:ubiquitin-like-conjugating enzyme ATG10
MLVQDHPLFSRQWLFIHPCNTPQALEQFKDTQPDIDDYILLWLGLVGPVVGLHIPLDMFVKTT